MMDGREHGAEQDRQQRHREHQPARRRRERQSEAGGDGKKCDRQGRENPRRSRHRAVRAHVTTSLRSANGPCAEQLKPSAIRAANELSGRLNSTKRIEIVVAALGKSDKSLWRVSERKQALSKSDRNGEIIFTVHDQQ